MSRKVKVLESVKPDGPALTWGRLSIHSRRFAPPAIQGEPHEQEVSAGGACKLRGPLGREWRADRAGFSR